MMVDVKACLDQLLFHKTILIVRSRHMMDSLLNTEVNTSGLLMLLVSEAALIEKVQTLIYKKWMIL